MIRLGIIILAVVFLSACGGGGGSNDNSVDTSEENNGNPGDLVTFTYTLEPGQIDTLPEEADHLKVILDGVEATAEITSRIIVYPESISSEEDLPKLIFEVLPGEHSYWAYALKGMDILSTIGPVTFIKEKDIPLAIPVSFSSID